MFPDLTYYFSIWSIDDSGNYSDISNAATTYARNVSPSAPLNLKITVQPEGAQLNLSWSMNSEPDIKGYKIYRGVASGSVASKSYIATILNPNVSYQDKSVANNTTYYYQATAIDSTNYESQASSEVSGCPVMVYTAGSINITFSEYTQYFSTVARFESNESWSAGIAVSSSGQFKEGAQALGLSSINSAVASSTFNFVSAMNYTKLNDNDTISIWVFVDNHNNLSGLKLNFGYTADFVNRIEYAINSLSTGWNLVSLKRSDGNKVGTFFWSNVVSLRADVISMPGKTVSIILDDLRMVSAANTAGGAWQQTGNGNWSLEEGSSGNTVFSQQDETTGDNISMMTTRTYTDFTLYAKMKIIVGGHNAGVLMRATAADTGYKFSTEGSTSTFVLRTLNGTLIAQGNYNTVAGSWYYIKVAASGTTKRAYVSADGVDYTLVCEETASNDYLNGYVGLYTNGTYTQFDDVHIMFGPSNLTVTPSDKQAVLTWVMDNTASFSKYFVYRASISADGTMNAYAKIRTVTVPGITDTDSLENGVTYYYRVTAIDTDNYESEFIGPAKSLPYEIIAPDTIMGKVTQMDGTSLTSMRCEAYRDNVLVQMTNTYTDGTYDFVGLVENSTYVIKVLLYEGEKASIVYREIMSGTKNNNFTLEIKYQLATIQGQISGYKPAGTMSSMSVNKFSDFGLRRSMLKPKNGIGFVEIRNMNDNDAVYLRVPVDESGKYEIPNLIPGRYVVKAYNGTIYSEARTVSLKEGQKLAISLSFPGLVEGRIIAYPNPSSTGMVTLKWYTGYGNPETTIKIYNIACELVMTVNDIDVLPVAGSNLYNYQYGWNCSNPAGDKVASGTYLFVLEVREKSTGEKAKFVGKFAIIK